MNRFIKRIVVGPLETNCYLLGDLDSGEAALIDPGGDGEGLINAHLEDNGLKLKCIINTHGHGDHISSNRKFSAPIFIHELDACFLGNPVLNLSASYGLEITSPEADRLLKEGDIIGIGSFKLEVLHTPGHTPGSISLIGDDIAFTGDTLFMGGVGRTDFIYGSEKDLIYSIKNKLYELDDSVIIYPGHGPKSTIGREKRENAFYNVSTA